MLSLHFNQLEYLDGWFQCTHNKRIILREIELYSVFFFIVYRVIEKNSKIDENINIEIKKNFDFSAENSTIIILPETRLSTQKGIELKYIESGFSQEEIFNFENPIESEKNFKKINFKNTWSYSKINIISNKFVIKKNITYYVYENIWNSNVVKTSWTFKININ